MNAIVLLRNSFYIILFTCCCFVLFMEMMGCLFIYICGDRQHHSGKVTGKGTSFVQDKINNFL